MAQLRGEADPEDDEEKLRKAEEEQPDPRPVGFAGEVRTLMSDLGRACKGDGFVIFGGDCAESFDEFSVDHVRDTFRVILQMALDLHVRRRATGHQDRAHGGPVRQAEKFVDGDARWRRDRGFAAVLQGRQH